MATTTDTTAEEVFSPHMDYPQHEATWEGFVQFVKWGIAALTIIVVALYFYIVAGNAALGTVLLLLIPVGVIWAMVTGSRRP
jgi:hypothetical protein